MVAMALFPKDELVEHAVLIREQGTKRVLLTAGIVFVLWFGGSKVWDFLLLRQQWDILKSQPDSLAVIGTLDSRGSYESNLFRVIQSEGSYRAEVTNHGWESIFDNKNPLCTEDAGKKIKTVIQQDSDTGYAMLAPYLRVGVNMWMNKKDPYEGLSKDYPITTTMAMTAAEKNIRHLAPHQETLGSLFAKVDQMGDILDVGEKREQDGGGGGERAIEHGLAIPAQIMTEVAPVVLTATCFRGAYLEEQPATVLGGRSYKVHLELNSEGRSRFFQWSHAHANENILFILKGETLAAGRIVQTLDVNDYEVTNLKDGVAAQKLVDFVKSHSH